MDLETLKETPPWDWPKDADKYFLEVLRDETADGSDRLLAAELAGDSTVINDELAQALLAIPDECLFGSCSALIPPSQNRPTFRSDPCNRSAGHHTLRGKAYNPK